MTIDTDLTELAYPLTWAEINCPCCGFGLLDVRLHAALTVLDELLPSRYIVASLTRCPQHNAEVGGTPDSRHRYGLAVDLQPRGVSLYRLISAALTSPCFEAGGIGLYPDRDMLHLDIRPRPARWGKIGNQFLGFNDTWTALWSDKAMPDRITLAAHSPGPPSPVSH